MMRKPYFLVSHSFHIIRSPDIVICMIFSLSTKREKAARGPEFPVEKVARETGKTGEVADSCSKEGKSDYFSNGRYRHYRLKGEKFHHQSLATKGAACPRPNSVGYGKWRRGDLEWRWRGNSSRKDVMKMWRTLFRRERTFAIAEFLFPLLSRRSSALVLGNLARHFHVHSYFLGFWALGAGVSALLSIEHR